MAGALYLPGADRTSRWFFDDYPNQFLMPRIEKTLLHSTETQKSSGCPGYQGGATAPQVTINPWKGYRKKWQHFPIPRAGRALGNPSSTPVSENKDGVFQVEIIGFSDPYLGRRYGCYLPELDDEGLDYIAEMLAFVHEEWPHPTTLPSTWPLYKVSSWADMNAAHMTSAQYDAHQGWLAHLHAPIPSTHGDVAINVSALNSKVKALIAPPPPPPPPPTGEVPTMLFYQMSNNADPAVAAAIVMTDGFTMRWVHGVGWTRIRGAYNYNVGKYPFVVEVKTLEGIALQWAGPLPTPDFPIPDGVKIVP